MSEPVPLFRPSLTDAESRAAQRVLASGWLSQGRELAAFEGLVAERAGRRFAVGVNSGTSALQLCLEALGVRPGDEVVTTPFTFIATVNAILAAGAVPVFVDIDPATWNLDPGMLEAALTPRTRGVLPVEALGSVAFFDRYERFARQHGLWMLEDSCEALGGWLGDRPAGSFGDCSVFGFFPNKQVTTGEGGVALTDDPTLFERMATLRNHGRNARGELVELGYNYKLPELSAAIGVEQLRRLPELLERRRRVAQAYNERLREVDELHLPPSPGCDPPTASWFAYVVRLGDRFGRPARDRIMGEMQARGIGCSYYFAPAHLQPHVRARCGLERGSLPVCEHVSDRTLSLPFFADLAEPEIDRVCETLKSCLSIYG